MNTVKILAVTLLVAAPLTLAACTTHHHKPRTTPTANYSARCMGDSYNGCYDAAREKCQGTLGYKVFAKKDNAVGKEIMYSCVTKR